jgi:hypothetical protein
LCTLFLQPHPLPVLFQSFDWAKTKKVAPPKKLGRKLLGTNAMLFAVSFSMLLWMCTWATRYVPLEFVGLCCAGSQCMVSLAAAVGAVALMGLGDMSLTINGIGSAVLAFCLLTLSGMASGIKRARGVSCCVVSYIYLAFVAAVALIAVALALILQDGFLEVRGWFLPNAPRPLPLCCAGPCSPVA